MQKVGMIDCLSKSGGSNEFMKIMKGGGSLEERQTATFLKALEPECFEQYKPRYSPLPPLGFQNAYQAYNSIEDFYKKSAAWREILQRFSGYIKACSDAENENGSNMEFLREMGTHFKNLGMLVQAKKVHDRYVEFKAAKVSVGV